MKENIILNLGPGQLTTGKGADLTSGAEKKKSLNQVLKSFDRTKCLK